MTMPKAHRMLEIGTTKDRQPRDRPLTFARSDEPVLPAGWLAGLAASSPFERGLLAAQGQTIARQIGRRHGNAFLQRLLAVPPESAPVQRAPGDVDEDEEEAALAEPALEDATARPSAPVETGGPAPAGREADLAAPGPEESGGEQPAESTERAEGATEDTESAPEQATYHINQRLDVDERGRAVSAAELRRRIEAAETAGHEIIRQERSSGTRVYEVVPHTEEITPEQTVTANGVAVAIRNATEGELASLQATLARVPGPHLEQFVARRRRLVLVDWTGAPHVSARQLSGGANIARARADIGEEAGSRIEITHTAMAQDGGELTVLHEIGHVVYDANLIPRTVTGDYGTSSHEGPNEAPAYAYMWYLVRPGRLAPQDRAAFDAAFERQGIGPGGQTPAAGEGAAQEVGTPPEGG
ncbi:MAG: hypothetical protein ACYC4R_08840 [Anaerolineae bacterium]